MSSCSETGCVASNFFHSFSYGRKNLKLYYNEQDLMLPLVLEDAIVHLFLTRLLKVPRNNPVFKRSGPFSSFPSFSTATKSRQSHQSNPFQNRQQQKTGVNWQQSRLTKYSQSISAKKKERRKDKKNKAQSNLGQLATNPFDDGEPIDGKFLGLLDDLRLAQVLGASLGIAGQFGGVDAAAFGQRRVVLEDAVRDLYRRSIPSS